MEPRKPTLIQKKKKKNQAEHLLNPTRKKKNKNGTPHIFLKSPKSPLFQTPWKHVFGVFEAFSATLTHFGPILDICSNFNKIRVFRFFYFFFAQGNGPFTAEGPGRKRENREKRNPGGGTKKKKKKRNPHGTIPFFPVFFFFWEFRFFFF